MSEAIRLASESLAARVDAICAGEPTEDREVRRAALATIRYVLRSTGRATPFGIFAGVAPAEVGGRCVARWGDEHRVVSRLDTTWLATIVAELETCPQLLERVDVVATDLAVCRGGRVEVPRGAGVATIRHTSVVGAVWEAAVQPIEFGTLAEKVANAFPDAGSHRVTAALTELVQTGFLITSLRAPLVVSKPLPYLLGVLDDIDARRIPAVTGLVDELHEIAEDIHRLNLVDPSDRPKERKRVVGRLRPRGGASRNLVATDLRLDLEVAVPAQVADEIASGAGALLRLSRQPTGDRSWQAYHLAFLARYGTDTTVPLSDVVHPDSGLGYPAGYPGSTAVAPSPQVLERDRRLLGLAWRAMADRMPEVVLTDDDLASLTGGGQRSGPAHVEIAARIHASSCQAIDRGDFTVSIRPGRSAGTFTSRFTAITDHDRLTTTFRQLPAAVDGALRVELSFTPAYPHAENVSRISPSLDTILQVGEHPYRRMGHRTIGVDDLVVTATRDRLHLVVGSTGQVVEAEVFHALAFDKQAPLLARFVAQLPRAFGSAWHEFDWGPTAADLPCLPRVRYGRALLTPALWRVAADELPRRGSSLTNWLAALHRWRGRWRCPNVVELRDADRSLRLDLSQPAHGAVLRAHLNTHPKVTLTETAAVEDLAWISGHTHEVALPLVTTRPAAQPAPGRRTPRLANRSHGHFPGSPAARWLDARVHSHPDRHDDLLAGHLPQLRAALGEEAQCWFVRYTTPTEPYHLRIRIPTPTAASYSSAVSVVGRWADQLRYLGLIGRVQFDTYFPESGRYGQGMTLAAAHGVFAADSEVVAVQLGSLVEPDLRIPLVVANMTHIAVMVLGEPDAWRWLTDTQIPTGSPAGDRRGAAVAVELALGGLGVLAAIPGWTVKVSDAWAARAAALERYRHTFTADVDVHDVVSSLMHMHHNRAVGIAPDIERWCRQLVRQAAHKWRARNDQP